MPNCCLSASGINPQQRRHKFWGTSPQPFMLYEHAIKKACYQQVISTSASLKTIKCIVNIESNWFKIGPKGNNFRWFIFGWLHSPRLPPNEWHNIPFWSLGFGTHAQLHNVSFKLCSNVCFKKHFTRNLTEIKTQKKKF